MKDQIEAALAKLDPENKDHWTSQGLPRIEAVNELLPGGVQVTRQEIQKAAPGFTRDVLIETLKKNPVTGPAAAEEQPDAETSTGAPQDGESDDNGPDEQSGEDESGVDEGETTDSEESSENTENKDRIITSPPAEATMPPVGERAPDHGVKDERYRALTEEINTCYELKRRKKLRIAELNKEVEDLDTQVTRLIKEREAEFPPLTPAEATRQYLQSQQAQRAAEVENRRKLQEFLGAQGSTNVSALDDAMARKQGHGLRRPVVGTKVQ